MMVKLSLFLFLMLGTLVVRAQTRPLRFSDDERRIITITDERRDADSLLPYLTNTNARTAWRAAIGLGNIGDSSVRDALLAAFLAEPRDSVADAEAFALGLLGPSENVNRALQSATTTHPTLERLLAIARTTTAKDSASAAMIVGDLIDHKKIDPLTEAKAYVEFALHHEISSRMMADLNMLANSNDADVRWRAAYAFARADDSLDLASRLPMLSALLNDLGSPDIRMFAATAFGKLHNSAADTILARAYRGEEEWRVRVNILRAFSQFPRMDSLMFSTLRLAVSNAFRDSAIAIQLGLTAADVVNHFVASGTLTNEDSTELRAWLDGFNGADGRNEDIEPLVCARLTLSAARINTPTLEDAIENYAQYHSPIIRDEAMRAAGTLTDTTYFKSILLSMAAVGPEEQAVRLEALDSMWQRANHLPRFRAALESNHTADLFRGLLIHIEDADPDAEVVTTALSMLEDTSIINSPALTEEADTAMRKYIRSFSQPQSCDQLLAAVTADGWLRDASASADSALHIAYDSANRWVDNELVDSIASSLRRIEGPALMLPARIARVSDIDWNTLEAIPPKMIINFEEGSIELHLRTEDAPLTVLNMVRLARVEYFSENKIFRIVPNFVIQSGDMTGTGYGGPGYQIRSEITPQTYDREGRVGMASSGKDTEGSQWFITECPTPHLDAHYTIWADVVSGMNVVFTRMLGEHVDSINAYK